MKRRRHIWASLFIYWLLFACATHRATEPAPHSSALPSSLATVASDPASEPNDGGGKPIRFEFDPDGPLDSWTRTAFFPFGPSTQELGILTCGECEVLQPKTMAIDTDGSIWIADNYKGRIVHFSPRGDFLAKARFQGAEDVRDLEIVRGDPVALLGDGSLVRIDARGRVVERGDFRHGDDSLYLYDLFVSDDRLFAYSFGTHAGRGLEGAVEVIDIAGGTLRAVPGLPLSDSSSAWVDLLGHGLNRWYRLVVTAADGKAHDHRFDILLRRQGVKKEVLADVDLRGVVADRVIVSVEPLFPPWYSPVSVGTWLLSLSPHGRVVESARVAEAATPPHVVTVGADGHVYRMRYRPQGVLIERLDGFMSSPTLGRWGLPAVAVTPDHGPIGTLVHIQGDGFADPYWQDVGRTGGGYGVFLIGASGGYELIAGGDQAIEIDPDGHLAAQLTIPAEGSCFQMGQTQPVRSGTYAIGLGCHACLIARFEVDPDAA